MPTLFDKLNTSYPDIDQDEFKSLEAESESSSEEEESKSNSRKYSNLDIILGQCPG